MTTALPPMPRLTAGRFVLREWALGELGAARLQLFVEPWNTASVRTAERAGYVREGLLRSWREVAGERRDFLVFSRLPG